MTLRVESRLRLGQTRVIPGQKRFGRMSDGGGESGGLEGGKVVAKGRRGSRLRLSWLVRRGREGESDMRRRSES